MAGIVYDFGDDEEVTGGIVYDFGPTPNEELEMRKTAVARKALEQDPASAATDVPSLPDPNVPDTVSQPDSVLDGIGRAISPVGLPMMEVVDSINNTVYGTAFDTVVAPMYLLAHTAAKNIGNVGKALTTEEEYAGLEWGDLPTIPDAFKNKTFVSNPEDAAFLDKGGKYAAYGAMMNVAAKAYIQQLGTGVLKYTNGGIALNPVTGKTMLGVESARVGTLGQIGATGLSVEADLAARMATAGHVASQGNESASPWITIPAEFVGTMTRSPAQYFDTATGAIMNADTGTIAGVKRLQDLWDKKFGQSEMDTASARMKAIADDPYAAKLALEAPAVDTNGMRTTSLSPSQVIDDAGIFVAERDLALRDPIFSGQLDDSMDMAQNSIANEMETLLNPSTGVYDFKALEDLMPKIKDDLLAGVDDQVRIARENMETMLKVYDGDVTAMSKEFDQEFNIAYGSIKTQENKLWEPITASNFQIDTTTFKQSIADIVTAANRETNIPAEKFAEFLGAGLLRTDSGWKQVPLTMRGNKKALKGMGKIVWPDVPMGNMQSPQVMKQVRTTLNEMVRDPNVNIHKDSAVKAQSAAVQALTDGASTVPPQFRNQYEAATAYSKKVHDTFTRSKITSKVKDAVPEKRLEVATGGKGAKETDMNLVTREFGDMYSMDVGSGGREAQSKMLKSAENMLMTKFANQVDSSDLASFDLFIAQHKTWFERFPAAGRAVKEARKQAKIGGTKVKDMDTAQTAANLDIFTTMTGRNPDQIMDTILKASQPLVQARRFKVMLSKNPDALGVFQDAIARRIMGQSLRNIESQVVGGGKVDAVDPAALKKISDQLAPLTSVFKGNEMKGLEMLQARMKVLERQLSVKGRSSAVEEEGTFASGAIKLAARLGGIKAVSTVFGSSSIVLAGTASNLATKGLEALSMGATSKIMAEAYRNPELMKILLSRNVTPTQLSALQDGSYQTGRTLYKALTGQITEEE